jgi:ketosteroid isomerase-like protein
MRTSRFAVAMLALAFSSSALISCGTQKNESASNTAIDAAAKRNETIVRTLFERFNKHDWKGMTALYAETAAFKDPSLGKGIVQQTRQQTIEKYTALQTMFPTIHDSVVAVYPSGEKHITVEFFSTGKAPNGTSFAVPICSIFTIENGVITSDWTYYDNDN